MPGLFAIHVWPALREARKCTKSQNREIERSATTVAVSPHPSGLQERSEGVMNETTIPDGSDSRIFDGETLDETPVSSARFRQTFRSHGLSLEQELVESLRDDSLVGVQRRRGFQKPRR